LQNPLYVCFFYNCSQNAYRRRTVNAEHGFFRIGGRPPATSC
jgi:hypothetical protein